MIRPAVAALLPVLIVTGCGGGGSTPPTTPSTAPQPGVAAGGSSKSSESIGPSTGSQPNRTAAVAATASPNPVPFSGAAITDAPACAGVANTWFYAVTLTETAGVDVTINATLDSIDGAVINDVRGQATTLRAFGGLTFSYRWCFTESRTRSVQSVFSGVDANGHQVSITAPVVVLQPRASSAAVDPIVITAAPNPVPFSGTPITDAAVCAGVRNTWFYTQTLTETAGVDVSLAAVTDRINGNVIQSDPLQSITLRARSSITYNYRWCLNSGSTQTAQSTFTGTDANGRAVSVNGPVVTLQAAPSALLTGTGQPAGAGRQGGGGRLH